MRPLLPACLLLTGCSPRLLTDELFYAVRERTGDFEYLDHVDCLLEGMVGVDDKLRITWFFDDHPHLDSTSIDAAPLPVGLGPERVAFPFAEASFHAGTPVSAFETNLFELAFEGPIVVSFVGPGPDDLTADTIEVQVHQLHVLEQEVTDPLSGEVLPVGGRIPNAVLACKSPGCWRCGSATPCCVRARTGARGAKSSSRSRPTPRTAPCTPSAPSAVCGWATSAAAVADLGPLAVEPAALLVVAQGALLAEDTASGLRLLDPVAGTVVRDEPGARSAQLLDADPSGSTLLELDAGQLLVRRGGEVVVLRDEGEGLVRAELGDDVVLTVVRTSPTQPQQGAVSVWALSDAGGLQATETVLCGDCRSDTAWSPATGAVVGFRADQTVVRWVPGAVEEPLSAAPVWGLLFAALDPSGRAWWVDGADLVGASPEGGAVLVQGGLPMIPEVGVVEDGALRWLGPEGPKGGSDRWLRLEGDSWVVHHGVVANLPAPLSDGRGVVANDLARARPTVGTWAAGDEVLGDVVEAASAYPLAWLEGTQHPRMSQAPCFVYQGPEQPLWVVEPVRWGCVR